MNIHEYQAKQLLVQYGVAIPPTEVCDTAEAAKRIAEQLLAKGADLIAVKSQIHAGGRGRLYAGAYRSSHLRRSFRGPLLPDLGYYDYLLARGGM